MAQCVSEREGRLSRSSGGDQISRPYQRIAGNLNADSADNGALIDEYSAGDTKIFCDKSRTSLDLSDPSVYRRFASCLRESGLSEISLFLFSAGQRSPVNQEARANLMKKRAAEQGLQATKIVTGPTTVFANFTPQ